MKTHTVLVILAPLLVASGAPHPTETDSTRSQPVAGKLDALPDRYIAIAEKFKDQQLDFISSVVDEANKNTSLRPAIYPPDVQWTKRSVTVAFSGGSPTVYTLIEQTAKEWTSSNSKLNLNFRKADGSFRTWGIKDGIRAADIRIAFDGTGYWSLLGRMADSASPNEATMNFEGFDTDIANFAAPAAVQDWQESYYHSVILHEFGHALGLAHEHFHRDCQADLKLSADPSYVPTRNKAEEFVPDTMGRSPGAIMYFGGPPNGWEEPKAKFNLDASSYFLYTLNRIVNQFDLEIRPGMYETAKIDQQSIMLYAFPEYLFKSGAASPCKNTGDGQLAGGEQFAIQLSSVDREYFAKYYGAAAKLE
jgi:hypothetical protein